MTCKYESEFFSDCFDRLGTYYRKTLSYCNGEGYKRCPLFLLREKGHPYPACEYFLKKPEGGHFICKNFDDFIDYANHYCMSKKNSSSCKRYQCRKEGKIPSHELMPDGTERGESQWHTQNPNCLRLEHTLLNLFRERAFKERVK